MGNIAEDPFPLSNDQTHTSPLKPRILTLFSHAKQDARPLYISAPMVRYSKLPFRLLVRSYGADAIFTPMMLAHEFIRSAEARNSDFSTHALECGGPGCAGNDDGKDDGKDDDDDGGRKKKKKKKKKAAAAAAAAVVIAQFASSDPEEFARAAEMIAPWVDGVDLNCGCPQSWAIKEGIGCALQESPELVAEMVRAAKARLGGGGGGGKSVSVKIRIHKDLEVTKRWVEVVQAAGVDFITVHGRTRSQRSSTKPDYDAIRELRPWVKVPMVANGDAYSLADVDRIAGWTEADGVMAARGVLENPAMFAGYDEVPAECVGEFVHWAVRCPIPFPLVLHHVGEMTAKMPGMTKKEKKKLMECKDLLDLIDFVEDRWGLTRR